MKPDVEIVFMEIRKEYISGALVLILCLLNMKSRAQENIPVGTWRSHFNYSETSIVVKTASKIFASTGNALTYFDPLDQSLNKLTKVDGLAEANISALSFDATSNVLAIGYNSGNLDIINAEGVENIRTLLDASVTENKRINQISFYKGKLYLATDFGVIVLRPDTKKITESFLNLGAQGEILPIKESFIDKDIIYLATGTGVLSGDLASGENLQDFNNWERYKGSLIEQENILSLGIHNNKIYAATSTKLYQLDGANWSEIAIPLAVDDSIIMIQEGILQLIVLSNQNVLLLDNTNQWTQAVFSNDAMINDILEKEDGTFWYADNNQGLSSQKNGKTSHFILNGPKSSNIPSLKMIGGVLFGLPQLDTEISMPVSNLTGYATFQKGLWNTIEPDAMQSLTNISDIAIRNNQVFVASFEAGLLAQSDDILYNEENSPLRWHSNTTENVLVSGIATDGDDNMWVTNFSNSSLQKLDAMQEWETYDFGFSASNEPTSISINEYEQVWMSLGLTSGSGVLAYDIEKRNNRYITSSNTSLPSNQVNDIAFGKDAEIWFATDQGVGYFPYSFGVIDDPSLDMIIPIFEGGLSFEGKRVSALAIDGGNRIWMGTDNGLWLFSENTTDLIMRFTVDDSPLPSNKIHDLAIDPISGELFIATDQGIVSYRGDAIDGGSSHSEVKIFPNPVLPNYTGLVGISGLVNDAKLKITTVSGKLVREITANGGGASWDIRDYNGRRVQSGVYLIISSNSDGTETHVGKIAVIN
jgi:ligand-binding sensor domain-containing protein